MTHSLPSPARDFFVFLARVLVGYVFVMHGWQKYSEWTLAGTADSFAQMGVPFPEIAAPLAAGVEIGGGLLLALGLFTPVAGLVLAADMVGAFWFAHRGVTVFVTEGGWELVAALGAAAVAIACAGPGRLSLDSLVSRNRKPARKKVPARA